MTDDPNPPKKPARKSDAVLRLEQLREIIKNTPYRDNNPAKAEHLSEADRERVELDGRKAYFNLRNKWSNWIIGWITGLIVFNCTVAILVGAGKLDYTTHSWFITAVTVETFLQIVGLGYVAVRFLFKDN